MKLSNKNVFLGLFMLVFAFFIGLVFYFRYDVEMIVREKIGGAACPLDAKICPDGSVVGRVPPRCEFAPCPSVTQAEIKEIVFGNFSTKYPANFYISSRDQTSFGITNKKWEGEIAHYPGVYVQSYTNVIPNDMSLRDWLDAVGDPNPPIGDSTPKDCSEAIEKIRANFQYPNIESDYCWYYGVGHIKNIKVANISALEFISQAVSDSALHTIFTYKSEFGVVTLFDVIVTTTGLSEPGDGTQEAYKIVLDNFQIRE